MTAGCCCPGAYVVRIGCAFLLSHAPGGPLRGGFVACFGEGRESWTTVEDLAEHLRWHRGSPSTYDAGPLRIAALCDDEHGPAVTLSDGGALLVHGTDPRPLSALQAGNTRFAALEWDGRVLRAGRDPMGEVPLFFRIVGGKVWFASEIHPLVAMSPTVPDLVALAAEAAYVPYIMRTGWEGILRVPPGSIAVCDTAMRMSIDAYWRPVTQLATRACDYPQAVAEFRDRFLSAVARRRTARSGIILSGGLDSAAVALAARDQLNPPRLVTVSFPELPETDELQYARAAAAVVNAPLSVVEGRTDPWDPAEEPGIFGTTSLLQPTAIYESAIKALAAEGVTSVSDGHDGDGVLGLPEDPYGMLLAHGDWARLVFLARHSSWRATGAHAIEGVLPPWMLRVLTHGALPRPNDRLAAIMKTYFRGPTSRRMAAEIRWRPPRRRWRRDQLFSVTPPATLVLEQMEMEAARLGTDVLHPFMDRDLVSFLISLPFSVKFDPVRSKPLLRDALVDLLPETIQARRGKVIFDTVLQRRVDRERCSRWIRESGVQLPDLDYKALFNAMDKDPSSIPLNVWIRLTRAHVFAAIA